LVVGDSTVVPLAETIEERREQRAMTLEIQRGREVTRRLGALAIALASAAGAITAILTL
tara:strand:- start:165 stop:341 length:177 start_codon:yes stop_codon:yes gene_type:complete